jgi:hypothetical protein
MSKKTGGPAFPRVGDNCQSINETGMTLRDYFAAKAMHALYTSTYDYIFTGRSRTPEHAKLMDELAEDAYQVADSMLKAREQ